MGIIGKANWQLEFAVLLPGELVCVCGGVVDTWIQQGLATVSYDLMGQMGFGYGMC